jgi:uncharacterized membrane protein YraQ (UPF0718 family)
MERVRKLVRILGQVVGAIAVLYVMAGFSDHRGPISGTEIILNFLAVVYGAISTFWQWLSGFLDQPVKVWELIVLGVVIVGAIKTAIATALAPMYKALLRIGQYDAQD